MPFGVGLAWPTNRGARLNHNDVLHQLMNALELNESAVAALMVAGGESIDAEAVGGLRARRGDEAIVPMSDAQMRALLNALIIERRGPPASPPPAPPPGPMRNNEVLKKLRIAFELKEEGMRAAFAAGGAEFSKGSFNALFRKKGHRNYRECSDALLGQFLTGLPAAITR